MSYSIAVPIETHEYPKELQDRMAINAIDRVKITSIFQHNKEPYKYKYSVVAEEDCDYW